MQISKTAVVGAGAMGGGIAQVITSCGLPVVLKDIDSRQLDLARTHVERIYQRRVDRGRLSADEMREKLGLIEYTLAYDGLREVDLVVEAVTEDIAVKRHVWAELDGVCPPGAIFASNTSALSITEMGVAAGRPKQMIGFHFFNPAHVMKLVEVIPGAETDPAVVDTMIAFARRLCKVPVRVRECPGFLVNRVLLPYLNEAVVCLQEGAATAREIDVAMGRAGWGWPMGPFALMDMLGLDVCHHIAAYLAAHYGERMAEAALLEALYRAGRLGEKAGQGFYEYPDRGHSPQVDMLIERLQGQGRVQHVGSTFSPDRLIARFLNEAFLCVEEEIASVEDVDTACVTGLGMQVRIGQDLVSIGPLAYADRVGLDGLLDRFQRLEVELGSRFKPAAILEQKVREQRGFKS